jgi:uncharacterized protein (TIGR02300 family)
LTLANIDLGEKRTCPDCGAKFYDLGKRPAVCPKCKATFDPSSDLIKPKRSREKVNPAPADDEEDEEQDDVVGSDDEEDIEIEETEEVDLVDDDVVETEEEESEPAARVPVSKKYAPPGVEDEEIEDEIEDEDDGLTVIDEDEEFDDEDIEIEDESDEEEL